MGVLAYFITFHTYGTWLHGRDKGSVDDEHNRPGTPLLPPDPECERRESKELKHPPVELDACRRFVVDRTIREVCSFRRWSIHALHVRTTHVHFVVSTRNPPERVLRDCKAYATRRLREAGLIDDATDSWSHHGSTRYLTRDEDFHSAVRYTMLEQGEPLEMKCPEGWDAITNRREASKSELRA
ncbi:MAG: hypothetical protein ACKVZJ_06755 [Phycisphaerales bacterium]